MHSGGEDYVAALNEPVTLSSLSPSFEGLIVVNEDGVFEGEINERFGVQLSLLSGVPERVTIETSTIEFQIDDNDPRPGVHTVIHCFEAFTVILFPLQLLELDFRRVASLQ